jgi:AcrR family transcriptional regulator
MVESQSKKRLPASERRKIILDAALRTFVESGYHGALMETIAERAHVTKPILYRHFPSKMALLLALLDNAGERLRESLLEPIGSQLDWRTAIEHHVRSYFDFAKNSDMPYRLVYSTDLNVDPKISKRIALIRNQIIELVAEHIRFFTDTEKFQDDDIEVVAVLLVGMAETAARRWMADQRIPLEVYERNLVMAVTNILARLPSRR